MSTHTYQLAILMLYVVYLLFAGYVITRFGRVITASRALPVWIVLVALGLVMVKPELLLPLAQLFGIQIVSNLVFATMILFLLFEALAGAAAQTRSQRQLRKLITRMAAREFAAIEPRASAPRALVVVPAYNEEETISSVIEQLAEVRQQHQASFDVVIVDDGSLDATAALAKASSREGIAVVSHLVNCGVGGVLMTGFTIAIAHGYEYAVQCDADGQHPVEEIPALLTAARAAAADVLVGSRFCAPRGAADESTTAMRRVGSSLIALALATFGHGARVTDPTSGFRVHSRRAASLLAELMPDEYPEPESIALCKIRGLSVLESPVRMRPRQGGESSISGWKSAIFMIKVLTSLLSFRLRHALGRAG